MNTFTKKYQVWEQDMVPKDGTVYYTLKEYDTLGEAMFAKKTNDWHITKSVAVQVTDAEEQLTPTPNVRNIQPNTQGPNPGPDPAEELATKYAGGPIGNLGLQ